MEKPLALSEDQVGRILATVEETGNDRVMVGFNRRFAPLFVHLREQVRRTDAPVTARYLVNAGQLDPTSWYLKSDTEGSRFAGEGGHFIDTLSALWVTTRYRWRGRPARRETCSCRSAIPTARWARCPMPRVGTDASRRRPSTSPPAAANGRLDNFTRVSTWTPSGRGNKRSLGGQDKGQRAEVGAFLRSVQRGEPMPIAFDSLVATTRATLRAEAEPVPTDQSGARR